MTDHPTLETFELFTMGALEDDAAFVAHVAGCDACSARLRREAQLEMLMKQVPTRKPGRILRLAVPLVAIAAAAAVVLALRGARHHEVATADPAVTAPGPVSSAGMALPPQIEEDGPDMQEVVKALKPTVKPCIEVMGRVRAEGSVKIELAVAADGTIERSTLVEASSGMPEAVGQCFVRAAGPARLPAWKHPYTRKLSWAYVAPPFSR